MNALSPHLRAHPESAQHPALRACSFGPAIAFLASFPPRACGIATFTADLAEAVDQTRLCAQPSRVIAIQPEGQHYAYGPRVCGIIERDTLESYRQMAHTLNRSRVDLVSIQHEYGLFGGNAGEHLLAFLQQLEKPTTLTLHTVLEHPAPALRQVTESLARAAGAVVVLAARARQILAEFYPRVDLSKVHWIPHGTPTVAYAPSARFKQALGLEGHTVLSTFGLLGPDKGVEYALAALPAVITRHPEVLYLVLGETHPELRRHSGEAYRALLEARVAELGVQEHVRICPRFLTQAEVVQYLQATDVYVLPSLNPAQIASGTLSYAVACGKAVVSTPFLHAQELLGAGRGMLARFRESASMAEAIMVLLDQPAVRGQMEQAAYRYGAQMRWPAVGRTYAQLFQRVVEGASVPLAPLARAKEVAVDRGGPR
jgi:glycosyltransferase involved in cell wall biosynthesis